MKTSHHTAEQIITILEQGERGDKTIGESCRAMFRETLGKTIAWVVDQVQHGQSLPEIKAYLALP